MEKHELKLNEEAAQKRKSAKVSKKKNSLKIIRQYCKGCGLCVNVCPNGCLDLIDYPESKFGIRVNVAAEEFCIGCQLCELRCPDFAIFANYEEGEK